MHEFGAGIQSTVPGTTLAGRLEISGIMGLELFSPARLVFCL